MNEIVLHEPNIIYVLKFMLSDLYIVIFAFIYFMTKIIFKNVMKQQFELEYREITLKLIINIFVAAVLIVLVFSSSTMRYLFDITFENVCLREADTYLSYKDDRKYCFLDDDNSIYFTCNEEDDEILFEYFLNHKCTIEYYVQSEVVKKIVLLD